MPVLALGVSFRRAPVDLLGRLAFGADDLPKAYQRLTQLESVHEGVILSTCNRVEVYADVSRYHQGFQDLKLFLSESRDVPFDEFAEPLYSHYEDDAAEHLFSVAGGLDSMVLGEEQILSQVRAAVRRARSEGAAGPILGALFGQAVRAGRRVRAETGLGASPGAFAAAGADLAEEYLGGLNGRSTLVVGAGTMGALAASTLARRGASEVLVLGRRAARARAVAERLGVRAGTLEDLRRGISTADMIVSSTGATGIVIEPGMVAERGGRPLFVLDMAVPRDVDPAVGTLPGVRLTDIDDLRAVVERRHAEVAGEAARAAGIVKEETARYAARRKEARVAPLIEALHARGEEVRAAELRRVASGLSDRELEALDDVTRRLVRRLLHEPVVRLKDLTARGVEERHAQALAELFGLDVSDA
jgi:glutamyl-tRNA reductase